MHWLTLLIKNWHFSWLICHLWCIFFLPRRFSQQPGCCAQHALYLFRSLGFVTELLCEICVKRFQRLWSRGSTVCEVSAAESRSSSVKVKLSVHLDLISLLWSCFLAFPVTIRASVRLLALIHAVAIGDAELQAALWQLCRFNQVFYWKHRRFDNTVSVAMLVKDSERLQGVSPWETPAKPTHRSYRPAWISYSPTLLTCVCLTRSFSHTHLFSQR